MPIVKLPRPVTPSKVANHYVGKILDAVEKSLNWRALYPLKLSDTPQGFALSIDPPQQTRPFVLTAALASGTPAAPAHATAHPAAWDPVTETYPPDTTVSVTIWNRHQLCASLPSTTPVDAYQFGGGDWHLSVAGKV